MLTRRGFWFLLTVAFVLVLGVVVLPTFTVGPAVIGIALFLWFVYEWVLFHTRSCAAVSRLRVSRRVRQGDREVPMLWAGLGFEVTVRIENPSPIAVPFAAIEDRTAVASMLVDGQRLTMGELPAGGKVEIVYRLKAPAPGVLRFEGIQVRVADLQGFFYQRRFIRQPIEFLVLPPLTDDEGRQRATKHFNMLPAPGIHRLRRPGGGSELLDLRDYRPGDPPKMIAWKPSARRDRLITKEFENDVPVRCVLFLDTTDGVRLGPPGNTLLTRLAGVAAVVGQASAANRDLVGLTTFDEAEAKAIAPARTKIHMIMLLRRLAETCSLQPAVTGVSTEQLLDRVQPLAHELYPELMDKRVNSMSLGRLWIPLLDRKWGWVVFSLMLTWFVLFLWGIWAVVTWIMDPREATPLIHYLTGFWRWVFVRALNLAAWLTPRFPILIKIAWMFGMLMLLLLLPVTLGMVFWFIHSIRGWFGYRKRELTRRKQVSALFSLLDGTGADGVERYVHDDGLFAERSARFLQEHQMRCPVPLYDEAGHYRFRCPQKAAVLADAMIRAVGRARDNELHVILADLAELGDDLAPVVRACRVARSRHHHVMVIVPWPADVPSPDDPEAETPKAAAEDGDGRPKPIRSLAKYREEKLLTVVRRNLTRQYHKSFRALRRQLSQAGATVIRINDGDPVQMVLDRLDRIRGMRSRR